MLTSVAGTSLTDTSPRERATQTPAIVHQPFHRDWAGPHVGAWSADRSLLDEIAPLAERAIRERHPDALRAWCERHRSAHQLAARARTYVVTEATFEARLQSVARSLHAISSRGFDYGDAAFDPLPPLDIDVEAELEAVRDGCPIGPGGARVSAHVWTDSFIVDTMETQLSAGPDDLPRALRASPWRGDGEALLAWLAALAAGRMPEGARTLFDAVDFWQHVVLDPERADESPYTTTLIQCAIEICVGPFEPSFGPGPYARLPRCPQLIQGFPCWLASPAEALQHAVEAKPREHFLTSNDHAAIEAMRADWRAGAREAQDGDRVIVYLVAWPRPEDVPDEGAPGSNVLDKHG